MTAAAGSGARPAPDRVFRALAAAALLVAALVYLGWLARMPLQRGNEAMYVTPSIHMIETGDYLVPIYKREPFLDKPPLTFWIVAASYRLLGVSVAAARLPGALACLSAALVLGLWVRRRAGPTRGVLAALVLLFSLEFALLGLSFSADALLALGVTGSVVALDEASRREGSDAASGALCGTALAFAFLVKGLLGVVLPVGAAAAAWLLDRRRPIRLARRAAWAAAVLVLLVAPWHWAMTRRLGEEFWDVFYWRNQFLRGATPAYMHMHRSALFYLGVLAWGMLPWSLFLPGAMRRERPSSAPVAWLAFGVVFLSLLVMKREVYLLPIYPAAAAAAVESAVEERPASGRLRRVPWLAGVALSVVALVLVIRGLRRAVELAGPAGPALVIASLVLIGASLAWGAFRSGRPRAFAAAAAATGLLIFAIQLCDWRASRSDPLPEWGARIRRECGGGCDGFYYGIDASSLDYYSGFDWLSLSELSTVPPRLSARPAFLTIWENQEWRLARVPLRWSVVDRRLAVRGPRLETVLGIGGETLEPLSLLRLSAEPPRR